MLKRDFFKGKRVTVFGIGLNGGALGAIEWLIQAGVREIIATDIRSREELAPTLEKLKKYKGITYVLGQHRPEDFVHVDMVVKTPGIPWTNEYIKKALEKNIPVETDASLFFQLVKNKTIAVTGTRGKSTTAALIAHILEYTGQSVVRVGINQIGFLSELGKVAPESVIVAELSSWRLSSLRKLAWRPAVAVVTNFFPDHQNYYKSLEAYARDKQVILEFQKETDAAVLNMDHAVVRGWADRTLAQKVFFSQQGASLDQGVSLVEGSIVEYVDGTATSLFAYEAPFLLGTHNQANVLAAVAAVRTLGITPSKIASSLKTFRGLPHRFEVVVTKNDITYINDTAATSPDALIAALDTCTMPVVLIAGGADKNFDFTSLALVMYTKAKAIILLKGSGTEKLLPLLEKLNAEKGEDRLFPVVTSMQDAVTLAEENTEAGDAILLSPGMASFGLFKNEFDRGEQFRKLAA
ncbi:MAG: UDP-N-acetylmuramoyl-L-alanine--D-glutamate ligase [Candidatus Moraniibacteriota bacterium]|nr:MAG: UDP-N-acetylmuramoyl-L-alanine--D-glutamate ligase [Candidatus Moranbacteria bacterium]